MTFWGFTAVGAFAALGIFLAALLVCRKTYDIEDLGGDVTYFSGHPELNKSRSGYLQVEGDELVFTGRPGEQPYFTLPIERVTGANAERHVAGLLGYAHVGPGAALGSNHFLLVNYLDGDEEKRIRFASRVGSAGTAELRDRILEARKRSA